MRKVIVGVLLLTVIMGVVITVILLNMSGYHQELNASEIRSAIAWSDVRHQYQLTDEEVDSLVKIFNDAKLSKVNENFAGITPSYGIQIDLSSGGSIAINEADSAYGNIEVQRDIGTKRVSYWIENTKLEEFLKQVCFAK